MRFRLLLLGLVAAAAMLVPREAAAYCKPSLYNCWCKWTFPCPAPNPAENGLVSEWNAGITAGTQVIGTQTPAFNRPMSVVTPGAVSAASLATALQMVRNATRGPANVNAAHVAYPKPQLHIPETVLDDNGAGQPAAKNARQNFASAGQDIEEFGAARLRVARYYTRQSPVSSEEEARIRSGHAHTLHENAVNAYARALVARSTLERHVTRVVELQNSLATATTLAEEIRLNAGIRLALMSLQDEVNEMTALYLSVRSASLETTFPQLLAPLPSATPTHMASPQERQAMADGRDIMSGSGDYSAEVQKARDAHNALTSVTLLREERPRLVEQIREHEDRKEHAYAAEEDLHGVLGHLYEDPDKAMTVLQSRLREDGTSYTSPDRYDSAARLAARIDSELQAQTPETAFGRRRINTGCARAPASADGAPLCSPFTTAVWSGSSPAASAIDGYYGGNAYERYQIQTAPQDPEHPSPESASFVLMQYDLEARKRSDYWAEMRRGGSGDRTMSSELWNEMAQNAPECLKGPAAATPGAFRSRPDLFDLDPECQHRTWSSGPNAGQPIDDSHLGGSDRSVWMIDRSIAEYEAQHGGRAEVDQHVANARQIAAQTDFREKAAQNGMAGTVEQTDVLTDALNRIDADKENRTFVSFQP